MSLFELPAPPTLYELHEARSWMVHTSRLKWRNLLGRVNGDQLADLLQRRLDEKAARRG